MLTLYDNFDSGNGYKVRLLLALLGQPYRWVNLDIDRGETHTPEFLAKNPNGRIPTIEPRGRHLPRGVGCDPVVSRRRHALSARGEARTRAGAAVDVLRAIQPRALRRHAALHPEASAPDHPRRAELPGRLERGRAALAVMEKHLEWRRWLVADRYTIADIALYAYTHVADEATLDLEPHPQVRAWLARVAAEPGHVPITRRPG